jgi:hypothetical protein
MDLRHLHSILQDISFYFYKNKKEILFNLETKERSKIDIKLSVFDSGINNKYVIVEIYKDNKLINQIKLSEIIDSDKDDYILEINLFLIKLYENIKESPGHRDYLHICPECKKIHSNNSQYISLTYVCNKCILKNDIEKQNDGWGSVYFFQSSITGLIKIGYSNNVIRRKKEIESAHGGELTILCTIKTHPKNEKYLHERFSNFRTKNEWFSPKQELVEYISLIKKTRSIQTL